MREKETRFIPADNIRLEVRAEGDDGETISGYAAVYDQWSPVYGNFRERIAPGFFDSALSREDADVRAMFNHDPNYVLGRTTSGTLRLESDEIGLRMENDPPATTWAADLLQTMKRGDVTGASFSFSLPDEGGDTWSKGEDGVMERTLIEAERLYDVGPVAAPWYPQTEVDVKVAKRSLEEWEEEQGLVPDDEAAERAETAEGEERGRLIVGMSDQDRREALRVALAEVETDGEHLWPEAVYAREVVYEMKMRDASDWSRFVRSYTMNEDGEAEVGDDREPVKRNISYEVLDENGDAVRTVGETEDSEERSASLALLRKMQKQKEAEAA